MNGRLERIDGRMELYSECSYQQVWGFAKEAEQARKSKRNWKIFGMALIFVCICVFIWQYGRVF